MIHKAASSVSMSFTEWLKYIKTANEYYFTGNDFGGYRLRKRK